MMLFTELEPGCRQSFDCGTVRQFRGFLTMCTHKFRSRVYGGSIGFKGNWLCPSQRSKRRLRIRDSKVLGDSRVSRPHGNVTFHAAAGGVDRLCDIRSVRGLIVIIGRECGDHAERRGDGNQGTEHFCEARRDGSDRGEAD